MLLDVVGNLGHSLLNADGPIAIQVSRLHEELDLLVRQLVTQAPHDFAQLRR